jgi:DNA-binding LytR/AlgR family response regulator
MSTVLIADDEPKLAQDLVRRLKRCWKDAEIVGVVGNGLKAAEEITRLKPDYAFLDIRMPGMTGLEAAAAAVETRVVFVTAYEEYAVAAFDASAVDYLLKPVSDARLAQCVLKLQQTGAPRADIAALLKQLDKPRREHLLYFQAAEKYTEVATASERHVIRTSLKDLLQQLDPVQFAQIHRATIVNIKNHEGVLSVSRAYAARFKQM